MRERINPAVAGLANLERGVAMPTDSRLALMAKKVTGYWANQGAQLVSDLKDSLAPPEWITRQVESASNRSTLTRDPVEDEEDESVRVIDANVVIDRINPLHWQNSESTRITFYDHDNEYQDEERGTRPELTIGDGGEIKFEGNENDLTIANYFAPTPSELSARQASIQQN